MGVLSNITRVLQENGLSMTRIEILTRDNRVFGSVYIMDTSGCNVNLDAVELAIKEIRGSIIALHRSPDWALRGSSPSTTPTYTIIFEPRTPQLSLGSMLWSQLEKLSSFRPI